MALVLALLAATGAALVALDGYASRAESNARARSEGGQLALALLSGDACARNGQPAASCLPPDFTRASANRSRIEIAAIGAPAWPGAAGRGAAWTEGGADLRIDRGAAINRGARTLGATRIWIEGESTADPGFTEARAVVAAARAAAGRPPIARGEAFATWREIARTAGTLSRRTDSGNRNPALTVALELSGNDVVGGPGSAIEAVSARAAADVNAGSAVATLARLRGRVRALALVNLQGRAAFQNGLTATDLRPEARVETARIAGPELRSTTSLDIFLCTGC